MYTTLDRFIDDYFVKIYACNLDTNGVRRCPEWWRHPEAVARLEAVGRAWELPRTDPGFALAPCWPIAVPPGAIAIGIGATLFIGGLRGSTPRYERRAHRRPPPSTDELGKAHESGSDSRR